MVLVTVGPEPVNTIFSSSLFCEKIETWNDNQNKDDFRRTLEF